MIPPPAQPSADAIGAFTLGDSRKPTPYTAYFLSEDGNWVDLWHANTDGTIDKQRLSLGPVEIRKLWLDFGVSPRPLDGLRAAYVSTLPQFITAPDTRPNQLVAPDPRLQVEKQPFWYDYHGAHGVPRNPLAPRPLTDVFWSLDEPITITAALASLTSGVILLFTSDTYRAVVTDSDQQGPDSTLHDTQGKPLPVTCAFRGADTRVRVSDGRRWYLCREEYSPIDLTDITLTVLADPPWGRHQPHPPAATYGDTTGSTPPTAPVT